MSIGGYFVTDEARKAKNWDILEQYQRSKADVIRLENEIKQIGKEFSEAGRALEGISHNEFYGDQQSMRILKSDTPKHPVATVLWQRFDGESLKTLLTELHATRKSESDLALQVKGLGLNL